MSDCERLIKDTPQAAPVPPLTKSKSSILGTHRKPPDCFSLRISSSLHLIKYFNLIYKVLYLNYHRKAFELEVTEAAF